MHADYWPICENNYLLKWQSMQLRQYWIHALHVVGHRCRSAHQLYTYVRLPYSLSKPRTLGIPTTSYKSWHRHALQLRLGWSVTLSQAGSAYNRPNNQYRRHGFWLINSVANKSQTYYAIFCCLPRLSSPVPGSGSCCHIAVQSHLDAQIQTIVYTCFGDLKQELMLLLRIWLSLLQGFAECRECRYGMF